MFSLSTILRIYIVVSIGVLICFFVMLTSVDVILEPVWSFFSTEIELIYRRLYVTVIIMSLTAITFGLMITIFVFDRGINKYKDFLRRFESLNQYTVIRPSTLRFPEQDEFGNLGQLLNGLIKKMDEYDQLKTNILKAEHTKFEQLAQYIPYPLLLINLQGNEPSVLFYNDCFRTHFLKKSVFIDVQGKPQIQYHHIEGMPITYLTVNTEENPPFLSPEQLLQIRSKNFTGEKKHTFTNMTFSDLSGDKHYLFENVVSIPINNNIERTASQMIYVFINGQDVEKEKKVTSEEIS